MRIEKLTENKIRIILNLDDLKEKNIDFHSFMSNSLESQDLFLDMLEQAEEEVGFSTKDYKLMIEAIATSDGSFILTVTRILPDNEINKSIHKKVNVKRKSIKFNKALSIYRFNNFDDFCEFCTYLNNSNLNLNNRKLKNTSLYLYDSKYYLVLYNINFSLADFKSFHCLITEFGFYSNCTDLFERKLIEYGKNIIKENAINICMKHFG